MDGSGMSNLKCVTDVGLEFPAYGLSLKAVGWERVTESLSPSRCVTGRLFRTGKRTP